MSINTGFESDIFPTSGGELTITFIGHGSLMLEFKQLNISVDPFSRLADYAQMPKADLILITHEHQDHLDLSALAEIRTEQSDIVLTSTCAQQVTGGIVMQNGDQQFVRGILIEGGIL